MTPADAVVIVVGLALFVLALRWGVHPGKWIDGAAHGLDWTIQRIRDLWRRP